MELYELAAVMPSGFAAGPAPPKRQQRMVYASFDMLVSWNRCTGAESELCAGFRGNDWMVAGESIQLHPLYIIDATLSKPRLWHSRRT